ncbi:MAG: integration host factor subunit beta, partial [Comamonadaceae bacterium]
SARSRRSVQIPEKRVPHFKPGKALREAVDGRSSHAAAADEDSDD